MRGQRGRRRPRRLYADWAYDSRRHRQELRRRHIAPSLARRGAEHGSGQGVYRWVVERTLGWLYQFRRLRVRYERRADIHEAFLSLGCSIICFRCLISFCLEFLVSCLGPTTTATSNCSAGNSPPRPRNDVHFPKWVRMKLRPFGCQCRRRHQSVRGG